MSLIFEDVSIIEKKNSRLELNYLFTKFCGTEQFEIYHRNSKIIQLRSIFQKIIKPDVQLAKAFVPV